MAKPFTVSMYNVGTVPLDATHHKGPSGKVEYFDDESKTLEFATSYKDKYQIVTVKNSTGDVIIKYHNGIERQSRICSLSISL